MRRKTALLLSGVITAFLMVIFIGLAGSAGWFSQQAVSAAPAVASAPAAAANSTDVAALQAQVATYRQQLQKAYSDLQAAYDQIQTLSQQQAQAGNSGGFGERRFRNNGGQPGLAQPNGSTFQGNNDD